MSNAHYSQGFGAIAFGRGINSLTMTAAAKATLNQIFAAMSTEEYLTAAAIATRCGLTVRGVSRYLCSLPSSLVQWRCARTECGGRVRYEYRLAGEYKRTRKEQ